MWSEFTIKYLKIFSEYKYNLEDDNILLKSLNEERDIINNFIKENKIDININVLSDNELMDKEIRKLSKVSWVYEEGVNKCLDKLNKIIILTWNEDKIIIKTESKTIKNIISRFKTIIKMIEYFRYKTKNKRKIKIYLILTELKKEFPENGLIDIKNVNTGYTRFDKDIIFIWRIEEYEKVLFHELIHFFKLDSSNIDYDNIINTHEHVHLYFEAVTDFYGIYYHIIYMNIISKIEIKYILEIELGFIKNQAMILNNYYKLSDWIGKPKIFINQNTPAFSYYILKYLLFEYFLYNRINYDYKLTINKIINKGFINKPFIKIKSSRMTLFQLNY